MTEEQWRSYLKGKRLALQGALRTLIEKLCSVLPLADILRCA